MHGSGDETEAARRLQEADRPWDAARTERALGGLERRLRRRRMARASLAVVASVCLVMGGAWYVTQAPRPAHVDDPDAMTLGDGSIIRPAKGAWVVVKEVASDHVRVDLAGGEARFEISHHPERTFVIEAGPVRVVVVGTLFSVARVGEKARVRVIEGHVRVSWGAQRPVERDLYAGDEGLYPDEMRPVSPAVEAVDAAEVVKVPTPESRPVHRRAEARSKPSAEWRRLAHDGGYREAYELIAAAPSAVRDDVDDLLLAADAARLSGHSARALPYLERVIDQHAGDDRAPMAAFTRGRLEIELGRPGEAAQAFDRAIVLGATGSLRENALARAVEAHARAGNRDRAVTLARTYISRYPDGHWLAAVKAHAGLDRPMPP